jgi:hypothetical protein
MKPKFLLHPTMWSVLLLVALIGGVTLTAILTDYPGLIELKLGDGWGQVTIDGRSTPERPTLSH